VIIVVYIIFIYISQGSVATQLKCGGIFSNNFTTNFHRMCRWKKIENRLIEIFGEDMDKSLRLTFFGPPCIFSVSKLDAFLLLLLQCISAFGNVFFRVWLRCIK